VLLGTPNSKRILRLCPFLPSTCSTISFFCARIMWRRRSRAPVEESRFFLDGKPPATNRPPGFSARHSRVSSIDFQARGVPGGVPGEALLAGLHEFLGPGVVGAGFDAFAPAKVADRYLAPEALQDDAYLLFRGVFAPGGHPDLLHEALGMFGPGFSGITFAFIFFFLGHKNTPSRIV